MTIETLYESLQEVLFTTKALIDHVNALCEEVDIIIPNHCELPAEPVDKFNTVMKRFKFKAHEEPYETFSWPGFIYIKDDQGTLRGLILTANNARDDFNRAITELRNNSTTKSKPVLMLCEYHRHINGSLPIIGSPDRLKLRQLTRHIRTFHNASRATFSHDIKNEIVTFDPSALIDQFTENGFIEQANELASYNPGELKKVHPPTQRWRANVKFEDPKPLKAHAALPVFFTGSKPEVRGIINGPIQDKKRRAPKSNKKNLVPILEQYGVFKYE